MIHFFNGTIILLSRCDRVIGVSTNPTRKHFFVDFIFVDQLLPVPIVGLLLPPPAGEC